ncbi:tetratricopeptide repeat protein [Campylobacter ureolyticus]|uniref:tetratricopeptide repeat protein n=1 Tax=Campylobacter ureolyticus TaxID=827 RepID=UPI001FC8AC06|nr:sel1 repeat family protein [Campylobacter ureolyticus]MCZ6158684.1 sel1 repeat family protein [Campylobacter ureolyticus]GKH61440.1 hypothetical protein CE91St25_17760 [Campylobacter ureolyticus]
MKKIILTTTFMICSAFASDTLISECEAGNAKACHNVGVEYYESKDFEKALEFFTKGCDGRAAKSCFAISEIYHNGEGVSKNAEKAIIYIEKACDESDDPEFCDQMDKYDI